MHNRTKYFFPILIVLLVITIFLNGCIFFPTCSLYIDSNPSGAKIFLNGNYTGEVTPALIENLFPGTYDIELTLDNPPLASSRTVVVNSCQTLSLEMELTPKIVYRALLIGIDKYKHFPIFKYLIAPPYDVSRVSQVLEHARFGESKTTFSVINTLIGEEATYANIMQKINSTFGEATNNDVSYFYFSGHGIKEDDTIAISPHDASYTTFSQWITVDELAAKLANIPGTKVVILDACHSGGFIGKDLSLSEVMDKARLQSINTSILDSFSVYDAIREKGNLASNGFRVIVSATSEQECFETDRAHPADGNPYGYFTMALCEGCGYNGFRFPYPADKNQNQRISLNEIYRYIYQHPFLAHLNQDVQVYPQNSNLSFLEY